MSLRGSNVGPEKFYLAKVVSTFKNHQNPSVLGKTKEFQNLLDASHILGSLRTFLDTTELTTCVKILLNLLEVSKKEEKAKISKLVSVILEGHAKV